MSRTRQAEGWIRLLVVTVAVALMPALLAQAGAEPVDAKTGLFGTTPDQVIRISVLNATGGKVTVAARLTVLDLAGRLLFEQRSSRIPASAGTFVDFTPPAPALGTALPGTTSRPARAQVRAAAAIEFIEDGRVLEAAEVADRGLHRGVRLTLEVYDAASGRTLFTLPFEAVGFDPQPEPPAQ
jgi:hypothetical protein